jgi:glyoxylase-like metal-dependent hydrolase (beta-lactamase superfamily II)
VLKQVADGVLVHQSEFVSTNTVVVEGNDGVLLVDPGVHAAEIECLADDLAGTGRTVAVGFSTHPHWDHLLWHARLGDAPRYGTARAAETVRERLSGGIDAQRLGIPEQVSLDLLGHITGLPSGATAIPWDGPHLRIVEHHAHAQGHAALVIEGRRALLAGDMLSDVLVPLLDVMGPTDPIEDYLAALALLETISGEIDLVVPGHGSVGGPDDVRARIDQDREYVQALRDGRDVEDSRVASPQPGWEWVADVHAGQVQRVAQRGGSA